MEFPLRELHLGS